MDPIEIIAIIKIIDNLLSLVGRLQATASRPLTDEELADIRLRRKNAEARLRELAIE